MNFIFLLLFVCSSSNQLIGDWSLEKVEMKDGSKVIERGTDFRYYQLSFIDDRNGATATQPLQSSTGFKYTIKGNQIQLNTGVIFEVEEISDHSLVIVEAGSPGNDQPDKLKRMYFTRTNSRAASAISSAKKSEKNGKLVYEASDKIYPQYKGFDLRSDVSDVLGTEFYFNDTLQIKFIISEDGVVDDVLVSSDTRVSDRAREKVRNAWLTTSGRWKPAMAGDKAINTVVTFKCFFQRILKSQILEVRSEDHVVRPEYPSLDAMNDEKATGAFKRGAIAVSNGKAANAIKAFNECIKADPLHIDAHYNRAELYWSMGNKEASCADWKTLADLKQVDAIKLLSERCR